jgi:hypothetical protein
MQSLTFIILILLTRLVAHGDKRRVYTYFSLPSAGISYSRQIQIKIMND